MKKVSVDLGRINEWMRLRFSLILKDIDRNGKVFNCMEEYHLPDGQGYRFNPRCFISIDLTSPLDKKEVWNTNQTLTISRRNKWKIEHGLSDMVKNFYQPNIYIQQNGKLRLNKQEIPKYIRKFDLSGKICCLSYGVIHDTNSPEILHKGVVFMINTVDNFAFLSYDDLVFLLHLLRSVNMIDLSMSIFSIISRQGINFIGEKISLENTNIVEEKEPVIENKVPPKEEPPSLIPDL